MVQRLLTSQEILILFDAIKVSTRGRKPSSSNHSSCQSQASKQFHNDIIPIAIRKYASALSSSGNIVRRRTDSKKGMILVIIVLLFDHEAIDSDKTSTFRMRAPWLVWSRQSQGCTFEVSEKASGRSLSLRFWCTCAHRTVDTRLPCYYIIILSSSSF